MKLAAAYALAAIIPEEELSEDYIIPEAFDPRVAPAVAREVARAAIESGAARIKVNPDEVALRTRELIQKANS